MLLLPMHSYAPGAHVCGYWAVGVMCLLWVDVSPRAVLGWVLLDCILVSFGVMSLVRILFLVARLG